MQPIRCKVASLLHYDIDKRLWWHNEAKTLILDDITGRKIQYTISSDKNSRCNMNMVDTRLSSESALHKANQKTEEKKIHAEIKAVITLKFTVYHSSKQVQCFEHFMVYKRNVKQATFYFKTLYLKQVKGCYVRARYRSHNFTCRRKLYVRLNRRFSVLTDESCSRITWTPFLPQKLGDFDWATFTKRRPLVETIANFSLCLLSYLASSKYRKIKFGKRSTMTDRMSLHPFFSLGFGIVFF